MNESMTEKRRSTEHLVEVLAGLEPVNAPTLPTDEPSERDADRRCWANRRSVARLRNDEHVLARLAA
jgi:hypothetical protein